MCALKGEKFLVSVICLLRNAVDNFSPNFLVSVHSPLFFIVFVPPLLTPTTHWSLGTDFALQSQCGGVKHRNHVLIYLLYLTSVSDENNLERHHALPPSIHTSPPPSQAGCCKTYLSAKMGRNKLTVGFLSTNLDSVRENKLEQQFRGEYVMHEKFPCGDFITHPAPNPDSTGPTGVLASVPRGGNTPVPNDLQLVNVEALARSRTYREEMTTLNTQQIGKCKYPPPKGEWSHSVTDLPPRGLGLTPRNFPSKKSESEELKLGLSNGISHIHHVESIPTSPYNDSSFLSRETEYSFVEVFPYYCFVSYAEIVGTVCAKMHDIVCSSPSYSVVEKAERR